MVETYEKRNWVNRAGADSGGPAHGRLMLDLGIARTS